MTDPWQSQWAPWAAWMGGMAPSPAAAAGPAPTDPQAFIEALRRLLAAVATPDAATAARTFTDFLRDQYTASGPSWHGTPPSFGAATANAGMAGRFPALGPTRVYQERAQRMTEAALRYDEAQRRLQRLWTDLLGEAAAAFAARAVAAATFPPTTAALHDLFDQWIDSAEEAYARAAHGESFCNALTDSVNAMSEWRGDLQAHIEDSAKLFDLPTRSELDSLARRVKALEAELRTARTSRPPLKAPKRTASKRTASKRRRTRPTSKP